MLAFKLSCIKCGKEYPILTKIWKCECGAPLDITYVLDFSKKYFEKIKNRISTIWRYREILPLNENSIVSLGEGWTPIVKKKFQKINLYLKLDYLNPTGSFKDRGASVLISYLKSLKVKDIVEDSSGNAGAAIAAYSSAAGIKCSIFVPENAPIPKIMQIKSYNARIVKVPGDRGKVHEEALKASEKSFYAGHLWNPIFIEGLKTFSYEVYEQKAEIDAVVIPIGSGGNLIGIYKGFKDLLEIDAIEEIPRFYGVQTISYASIYKILHPNYKPERIEETLADGIAVPDPPRKHQIVSIIKNARGDVVLVNNYQILNALKRLAKWGFFVEPTSATVLAAVEYLVNYGILDNNEKILLPLTGFGFKAIDKIEKTTKKW